jgi:hypothetical protein
LPKHQLSAFPKLLKDKLVQVNPPIDIGLKTTVKISQAPSAAVAARILRHEPHCQHRRGLSAPMKLSGLQTRTVNLAHHEAMENLAPHFEVGTWAPDGVIQSIHKRSGGWVFGVKFHPDELVAGSEEFMPLFREFAAQARALLRQRMAISASLAPINRAAKLWQSFMA